MNRPSDSNGPFEFDKVLVEELKLIRRRRELINDRILGRHNVSFVELKTVCFASNNFGPEWFQQEGDPVECKAVQLMSAYVNQAMTTVQQASKGTRLGCVISVQDVSNFVNVNVEIVCIKSEYHCSASTRPLVKFIAKIYREVAQAPAFTMPSILVAQAPAVSRPSTEVAQSPAGSGVSVEVAQVPACISTSTELAQASAVGGATSSTQVKRDDRLKLKRARLHALDEHIAGLALSGGGIRSATHALGVLQGLADLKILSRFDYLSTVSGGGYIGGWLTAWICREGGLLDVEKQLSPSRITQSQLKRELIGVDRIVDEEPEPVHHLRSYSNYMTPRPGILSMDTWAILVIYVRNALINMLLLVPLAMIVVLASRLLLHFYTISFPSDPLRQAAFVGFCLCLMIAVIALGNGVFRIHAARSSTGKGPDGNRARDVNPADDARGVQPMQAWELRAWVMAPLLAAAFLGCWTFTIPPPAEAYRVRGETLKGAGYDRYEEEDREGNVIKAYNVYVHWGSMQRRMPMDQVDYILIECKQVDVENKARRLESTERLTIRVFDGKSDLVAAAVEDEPRFVAMAGPFRRLRERLGRIKAWNGYPEGLTVRIGEEAHEIAVSVARILDHPHAGLRLPDSPELVHDIDPFVNQSYISLIEWIDNKYFNQDEYAFEIWQRHDVIWISYVESGFCFAILAVLAHIVGYIWPRPQGTRTASTAGGEGDSKMGGRPRLLFAALVAGLTGGFLFYALISEVLWRLYDRPYAVIAVGPPLALMVFVTATFIEVWLLGRWQDDGLREWWARVCAWLTMTALAWFAFFAVTLYGPMAVNHLLTSPSQQAWAFLGWLVTFVGGAMASRRLDAIPSGRLWLRALTFVAPPAFLVGLLLFVSIVVDSATVASWHDRRSALSEQGVIFDVFGPVDRSASWFYWNGVLTTDPVQIVCVIVVCVVLVLIASFMSNANLFSLNSMYANRLTRCYLQRFTPGWHTALNAGTSRIYLWS